MAKLLTESSEAILQEDASFLLDEESSIESAGLYIAGEDFTLQYKTNSARIRELVQNKSGVMNVEVIVKAGDSIPLQGSEIVLSNGVRRMFAGYITRVIPIETGKGYMFVYSVEASDYGFIFGNKRARRAYTNMTMGAIITDLMNTYVDESYGYDLTNVETGPMITSISFDHVSVRNAFEKLSKLTGYIWYVDYNKNLYFTSRVSTPAPESITDVGTNISKVNIAYDTAQVRNKVIVIGSDKGEASNAPTTQSFTGDGISRIFKLDNIPASVGYIKLNGVDQNFHEADEQVASDYIVYYDDDYYLRLADSSATPTGIDTIEVSYYPYIAVIALRSNQESIDFFKALDSGDGVWDYTIKDQSITTKQEAAERADKELLEFAFPLVRGEFETRSGLLQPTTVFSVGQALTVNMPSYGILTDTTFLIQEVNIELVETLTEVEYKYKIRFGGKLSGIQEFLESLATEDADAAKDSTEIKTIEAVTDLAVTVDSGLSYLLQTPPYKYGNVGTPRGKWNLSEWS